MFTPYHVPYDFVTVVGGGVSTGQILQTLRILYMGGVKCGEKVARHIISGEGPCKFFQVYRSFFRPEDEKTPAREVLEYMKGDRVTYEIGLRWFLTNPNGHLLDQRRGRGIAVLPADPLILEEKTQALVFTSGGDGPCIYLVSLDLDRPFQWDFIGARELSPNPFCS